MGGKSSSSAKTPYEAPNTLSSAQDLRVIDAISEGVIAGFGNGDDAPLKSIYFNDTPVQNSDGSFNFNGVEAHFLRGTEDQSYIPGFDVAERSVSVGAQVKQTTPITRTITDREVSRLRVTLGIERNVQIHENGDSKPATTELKVDLLSQNGIHSSQVLRFTEKSSSMYHQDLVFTDLPPAPFSLKVSRVSADSKTDKLSNNTYFISYVEQIDSKLNYPHTALCAIKINSEQFGNGVPTRNYLLRGKIIQVPSNYDPETRQYAGGLWDGSFKAAYSNNPAWVFYDLLTNPRYSSLASRLNLNDIDKWSLYNAAKYCDELVPDGLGGHEPRYVCNAYITAERQAGELLTDLASVFMGLPVWNGSQVSVLLDQHRDPVALYSNSNVVDGTFTYMSAAHKAIHTAITVQYIDKSDGYRTKTEFVADYAAIERYGYNPKSVTAFGCTSRGQAARFGEWLLQTELRQQNTVSFSLGREGLKHLPYDIIQIADNFHAGTAISGRVIAISDSLITLDREIVLRGETVLLYLDGGVQKSVKITARPKPNQIQLASHVNLVVGDVWAISGSLKTVMYRTINIKENKDGTYSVTALLHDAQKYGIVDNSPHFDRAISTLHATIPELYNATVSVQDGGIVLTWDNLTADGTVLSYDIKIFKNNILYRHIPDAKTAEIRLENLPNGNYRAEIRGRNVRGVLSKPLIKAWQINYTITALRAVPKTLAIELNWVLPEVLAVPARTEIWYSTGNVVANAQKLVTLPTPQNSYTLTGVSVIDSYYFWARLIDENGNAGEYTSAVLGQADPDPAPIVAQIQGAITQSTLSQALINQLKADDLVAENRAKADAAARITAEANARATAIRAESVARSAAVNAAADTAAQNLRIEIDKLNTAIATAANQAQTNLTTKANELIANTTALGNRVTSVENVNAQQATAIQTVSAAQNATAGALEVEKKARADGDKAEAAQRATLAAKVSQNTAAIATETQARTTAQAAEAQAREALATRVATAESALTAERQVRADADAATNRALNAATTRIGTAESSIGALQQSLATQQQALAQSTQTLAAKIDGLNIGGTNLLFDSEFSNSLNWVVERSRHEKSLLSIGRAVIKVIITAQTGAVGVHHAVASRQSSVKAGETYTLSFIARASQYISLNYIYLMRVENGGNQFIGSVGVNGNWQRCKLTFTANWDSDQAYLLIGSNSNYVENQWFEFHSVKLEYGNVATDWSPTPADLDKRDAETLAELIAFKQAQATKDNAQTAEIDSAKSQINSSKSAIEQIRSTKADKTEVATLARTTLQSEWQTAAANAANAAKSAAATDAQAKADAAKQAAITAAATAAQTKADAAKAAAIATASGDASSKADAAKATAIADAAAKDAVIKQQAATDAQTKADAAKAAAIAEANRLNTATVAKVTALQQAVTTQNQATATRIDGLAAKVDGLQIGGRNILHQSDTAYRSAAYSTRYALTEALVVGEDVVITLWGSLGNDRTGIGVYNSHEFSEIAKLVKIADGVYQGKGKWVKPMRMGEEVTPNNTHLNIYFYPISATSVNTIAKVKLERGTVGTDWTPAPEDVDSTTSTIAAELTAFKQAQATKDNAQTAEIDSAKSQINSSKSAIESIRSTKADKTEVATLARTTLQSEWQTAAANAANTAKSAAATDAQAKADAAKQAAITAAATAAQTKADAAKAAAIATASGDASSKADAAKAAAIADAAAKDAVIKQQAATDAQTKADAAKAAAIAEANRLNTATVAKVTALQQAVTTQNQATASQITSLTSKIGAAEANIQTVQTATTTLDGKVQALHTVKTEVVASGKKVVAGLALGADGATGETQFNVHAQKFAVWDGTMLKPVFAVVTQNGKTQTAISGDLIADGTIHGKHIAAGQTIQSPIINASTINGATVNSGMINGGQISIGNGNFVVDSNGNLVAKSGRFEGTVYADKLVGDVLKMYLIHKVSDGFYQLTLPAQTQNVIVVVMGATIVLPSERATRNVVVKANGVVKSNRTYTSIYLGRIPNGESGSGATYYADVYAGVEHSINTTMVIPSGQTIDIVIDVIGGAYSNDRRYNLANTPVAYVGRA